MSTQRFFEINDDYRITSDKYQYILLKKRIVQDKDSKNYGEAAWDTEAFLPNIEDVLKFFMERGIKDEIGDIHAIAAWVNEIESRFTEFLDAYKSKKETE